MNLESLYFRKDFYYNAPLVEKSIKIIQSSNSPRRQQAFKVLVFKMMKDIVKKNIANYLNLLHNMKFPEIPERDELVADCWVVFDKCVNKFIVDRGYNFYFYFNKSLSRNFFREYYKKQKLNATNVDITEVMMIVNKSFHVRESLGSVELLLDNLQFTELERSITISKVNGQRVADFLKIHTGVTSTQYTRALRGVREKLAEAKKNKEL